MPIRVHGGVFTDQILSGSLRHFAIVGADFSGAVNDHGKPVHNSAAEIVLKEVSQKATVVIMYPTNLGMSLAIETGGDWSANLLETRLKSLGTVGIDEIDLSEIQVTESSYNLHENIGDAVSAVIVTENNFELSSGQTYYIKGNYTVYLPSLINADDGDIIRLFKSNDVIVTIRTVNGDLMNTRTGIDSSLVFDRSIEIVYVANGQYWELQA